MKVIIVVGYDNELTKQDREMITNVSKNRCYEFHLLYYIPKIPAECMLLNEMVVIEQQYRKRARQTLHLLSQALHIPLAKKNGVIDYTDLIQPGPTAIFYTIKQLKHPYIVLTSHPDKLNPDLWDRFVNWLKVQKLMQWLWNFKGYANVSITKITPLQFIGIVTQKKGVPHEGGGPGAPHSQQIVSTLKREPKKIAQIKKMSVMVPMLDQAIRESSL